jgi:hypothetical protein
MVKTSSKYKKHIKQIVGGGTAEMKIEEVSKKDKLKNFSIVKTPVSKMDKLSQDKLNKFVNLKI